MSEGKRGVEQNDSPKESGFPAKRTTRRSFIRTGVAVAGGIILGGDYIKPTLQSMSVNTSIAQAYGPTQPTPVPPPTGQSSIEVKKTIDSIVSTVQGGWISGTMTGTITIKDASDAPVGGTITVVNDVLEYRASGAWTTLSSVPYPSFAPRDPLNDTILPSATNTYSYTITFVDVPANATALRNTVEITMKGRDKVFLHRCSVSLESNSTKWIKTKP